MVLEADSHQKISITYTLMDKMTSKPMTSHQSFVKLTNKKTSAEIIFVSEADSDDNYKFEMVRDARMKLLLARAVSKMNCSC